MNAKALAMWALLLPVCAGGAEGAGMLVSKVTGGALEIVSQRVLVSIDNQVARTHVTQVFRNPCDRTLEGVYVFPVPEGAGVSDFAMWIAGQRRPAVLVDARRARQIYDSIVQRGRDPGLLEQIDATTFRMSVFPILPRTDQKIELSYDETLPVENGACRYVYPLAMKTAASKVLEDFTLAVRVRSVYPIKNIWSSSHDVEIIRQQDQIVVGLEKMQAALDRDFVLHYEPETGELGMRVVAQRGGTGDGTFLVLLAPGLADDERAYEKDVILLMDTSGSMSGRKIDLARNAMRYFVNSLGAGDRFNVLTFSTTVREFRPALVSAAPETVASALAFINSLEATGGTAIDEALASALEAAAATRSAEAEDLRPLRIIFVTDGEPTVGVTDTREIVRNATKRNQCGARVFSFGVETNVDCKLLNLLAAKTGGTAELIAGTENLEVVLSDFFADISRPVFSDIEVEVEGVAAYDTYPKHAPDLFQGGQVQLVGRYAEPGPATIRVTGTHRGRRVALASGVNLPERAFPESPIGRLFAKRKIEFLMDEIWWHGEKDELRHEIVRLSQEARIVTPYTSMLVLETDQDYRRFGLEPPENAPRERAVADATGVTGGSAGAEAITGRIRDAAPGSGPGPTTPGPGAPSTPGVGRGPMTPGAGSIGPGGAGGGARGTVTGLGGGKKCKPVEGFEQWQFWWENNKDRYLNLRERLGANVVQSGSAGFLTGMGSKQTAATSRRPAPDEVIEHIVPILRSVLDEDDADIVDSAVLALARTVRSESAATVLDDITAALGSKHASVRQSAILSLGVLGSRDAIPTLLAIMNDTREGRALLNQRGSVSSFQRAFAAIALGFIKAPETIQPLMDIIDREPNSELDLRSLAILSLGLFTEQKEEIVQFLVGKFFDRKMDRTTRAQIPVALGRLGEPAAVALPSLLEELKGKKTDIRVQESCVVALGQLGRPEDEEVLDALYDVIENGQNPQSRHFAFIALAQIGGRAARDPEAHTELLARMNGFLLRELNKPKQRKHYPWASLALAILGREYGEHSRDRQHLTIMIMDAFDETNNPSHKAAHAIALGLLNATPAAQEIYAELLATNDTSLKGYLAVSLGLLRYTEALGTLRILLLDNKDAKMRLQVATALGLMGDVEAVSTLREGFNDAKTLGVMSSIAKAIGLIGDKSAIPAIEQVIRNSEAPGLSRAFACVALGLIGEKTDLPWNAPIAENSNYRTVVPTFYEILDIL